MLSEIQTRGRDCSRNRGFDSACGPQGNTTFLAVRNLGGDILGVPYFC